MYGYVVPDNVQKEITAIKKYNSRTKIVFNMESVTNLFDSSPGSRTDIDYGNPSITSFEDK